jgi:hypothetical protein
MDTTATSALHMVLRNLTEAELHDLLEHVQTELLHRPEHHGARTVAVVTKDDAALLALYRRLSPSQRALLRRMAADEGALGEPDRSLYSTSEASHL